MQHRFKITSLFFLLSCIFLFAACKSKPKENSKARGNAPVEVDVLIASPQPVNNIIEVNGTVVANEFTEIRPEVSGRLTYLNIPEGSMVSQGMVLAKINSADLAAQVAKSKVQLDLAQKTADYFFY